MKILIVTAWYSPAIHPRAHRWSNIAAYWALNGHEVTVLTSRHAGGASGESAEHGVRVIRTGYSALHEAILHTMGLKAVRGNVGTVKNTQGFSRLFAWCYRWFWKYWIFPDDACLWYFPAKKKLFQLIRREDFDLLITVSMPFTGHWLGMSAKQTFGFDMPVWLADIGDPFSVSDAPPSSPFWHKILSRKWEHRLLQSADHVVVTTATLQNRYPRVFEGLEKQKIRVIPPLYVPYPAEKKEHIPVRKKYAIGYFGALYNPVRPPEPFLAFVHALQENQSDLYQSLEFHFYGDLMPEIWSKIKPVPNLHWHGLYSREKAAAEMQKMDFLLNIGNYSSIQLPSKSVDYMASGIPILHLSLVNDDPFVDFFEGYPAFFSIPIKENKVVIPEDLATWIKSAKPVADSDSWRAKLDTFSLRAVSAAYLENYPNR